MTDDRYEGQIIGCGEGEATWVLRPDHTGHIPREYTVWYLICTYCGEGLEEGETCSCIQDEKRGVPMLVGREQGTPLNRLLSCLG